MNLESLRTDNFIYDTAIDKFLCTIRESVEIPKKYSTFSDKKWDSDALSYESLVNLIREKTIEYNRDEIFTYYSMVYVKGRPMLGCKFKNISVFLFKINDDEFASNIVDSRHVIIHSGVYRLFNENINRAMVDSLWIAVSLADVFDRKKTLSECCYNY